MQVLRRPDDLAALAAELTERHRRACASQQAGLDAAYRTFAAAAALPGPLSPTDPCMKRKIDRSMD